MPFKIIKTKEGYKLYNEKKRKYANMIFKTKETALSAGLNYMKYRGEIGKLVGNKIIKVR